MCIPGKVSCFWYCGTSFKNWSSWPDILADTVQLSYRISNYKCACVHKCLYYYQHHYYHNIILLVCVWEDQRENQYYICHKISSILYGKYSTVVSKYSTVILILVCNQCSNQPPLISLPAYVYSSHSLNGFTIHYSED